MQQRTECHNVENAKKGAAPRCPFSHPHGICFDLVLALDQVWLGVVRPIV